MLWFISLCFIGYFVYVIAVWNFHRARMNKIKAKKEAERERREQVRRQKQYEKEERLAREEQEKEDAKLRELYEKDPQAYNRYMYKKWILDQQNMLQSSYSNLSTSYSSYYPTSMVSQGSLQHYNQQVLNQYQSMQNELQNRKQWLDMIEPRRHGKITGITGVEGDE